MNAMNLTYTISSDGYDIFRNDTLWITQHEPHIPNKKLSYEENAVAHIAQLAEAENITEEPSLAELNRADIDYLFMVMEV